MERITIIPTIECCGIPVIAVVLSLPGPICYLLDKLPDAMTEYDPRALLSQYLEKSQYIEKKYGNMKTTFI